MKKLQYDNNETREELVVRALDALIEFTCPSCEGTGQHYAMYGHTCGDCCGRGVITFDDAWRSLRDKE